VRSARQASCLDRIAVVVSGPAISLSLQPPSLLCRQLNGALDSARKEVSMARLISLAAVAASVLSAAFLAGLTCGG
jgi:hypothetical protein